MFKLILASSSTSRRQVLSRLKIDFIIESPDIDETPFFDEAPEDLVLRLAKNKAAEIRSKYINEDAWIIGADQVAFYNQKICGKPHNYANAFEQLISMSGQEGIFYNGLCLMHSSGNSHVSLEKIKVQFRKFNHATIEKYLSIEQPYNCAGSLMSEGLGITLLSSIISDDPTALLGLPLIKLCALFEQAGVDIINFSSP